MQDSLILEELSEVLHLPSLNRHWMLYPRFQRLPGSSPGRIQGFPQKDGVGERIDKKRKRSGKNFAVKKIEERRG